jgi:hypothetical protein
MWTSEAVAIGFPNRLFVVGADKKGKVAWPQPPDPCRLASIRSELLQQLSRLPLTLEITAEGKEAWEQLYLGLPSSEHVKRIDTLGFRLLALIALTTGKTAIDSELERSSPTTSSRFIVHFACPRRWQRALQIDSGV